MATLADIQKSAMGVVVEANKLKFSRNFFYSKKNVEEAKKEIKEILARIIALAQKMNKDLKNIKE